MFLKDIIEDTLVPSNDADEMDVETQLVIWGTDVVVNVCKNKFKKFVLTFVNPDVEEDERNESTTLQQPLYLQRIDEVILLSYFSGDA